MKIGRILRGGVNWAVVLKVWLAVVGSVVY
jgi:hypothetical protein